MHLQFNILDLGEECKHQIGVSEDMTLQKFDDMIDTLHSVLNKGEIVSGARRFLLVIILKLNIYGTYFKLPECTTSDL